MEIDHDGSLSDDFAMQMRNQQDVEIGMGMGMAMDTTSAGIEKHYIEEMEPPRDQQYLQSDPLSSQDTNDWTALPELPKSHLGDFQSVSNIYRSSFAILSREWGCTPATCLPEKFRLRTKYSLALVVRLAELALHTRANMDAAHATLSAIARGRSVRMNSGSGSIKTAQLARGMAHKRYTEFKILEYVDGITIEDVEDTKSMHHIDKSPNPSAAAQAESRADRAAKRTNRYHADCREAWSQTQNLGDESRVGEGLGGRREERPNRKRRKQLKQERARDSTKGREGQTREAGMFRRVLGEDIPAVEYGQMRVDGEGDQAMSDSAYVLAPRNSPTQHASGVQKPKLTRKTRSKKVRTKVIDGYMAHIFDDLTMEPGELDQPQQVGLQSLSQDRSPTGNGSHSALPFERSTITSSPSLSELQKSMLQTASKPLLPPLFNHPGPLCDDEDL